MRNKKKLSPAPAARFTRYFSRKGRKGAKLAEEKKGLMYVGLSVSFKIHLIQQKSIKQQSFPLFHFASTY
jgi:hypothetical protein